jgi:hypothetical protein
MRLCECGCGIEVKKQENRFLQGHNTKGTQFSQEHKKKISSSNTGKHNISKSEETKKKISNSVSKLWQDESYREKLVQSHTNPNEEIIRKFSESHKNKHPSPETKKKMSSAAKEKFKDPGFLVKYWKFFSIKPNKPETFLITFLNILLPNKYQYVGDYKVWINGKNPDWINREDKKIIEYFGAYWHDKEVTGLDRETHENERIEVFKKGGYETLVIWQEDLEDIDKLKEKILSF